MNFLMIKDKMLVVPIDSNKELLFDLAVGVTAEGDVGAAPEMQQTIKELYKKPGVAGILAFDLTAAYVLDFEPRIREVPV